MLNNLAKKFIDSLSKHGFFSTSKKTANWILQGLYQKIYRGKDPILKRRLALSNELNSVMGGVIRYGPFKGFRFARNSWWGAPDRASMLLGMYEQEVLSSMRELSGKYRYLIDVGAADGYYGVGVLVGRLFERSFCYEISQAGREAILNNAVLNGVSDQIVVRGKAEPGFQSDFSTSDAACSVVLIDIEGGEFDVLDHEALKKFSKSVIFLELHDWFFSDGDDRLQKLREQVEEIFKITVITTGPRDPSVFSELRQLSDTDRWLICSEGRARLMTWWRLDPI